MDISRIEKELDPVSELAASLYVWGQPLVGMHRTRALHCSRGGQGILRHRLELATARDRTLVGPNNDTLYSSGPNEVSSAGALFFDELREALSVDPPAAWHPMLTSEQQALLETGADLEILASGVVVGNERIRAVGFGADRFRNGWGTRSKGTQFGQDVLARAACAQFTLAGHHRQENSSYSARHDSAGEPLTGGETPADISTWLPAPAGPYLLGLRVYEGRQDVVEATWFPPPLTRI